MQKVALKISLFIIICLLGLSGCTITMNNTYIDYTKYKTITVQQFETKASNAPPQAGQQFSERFKLKVLSDTRLRNVDSGGDFVFSGDITKYELLSVAPQADQTIALQQLKITVTVSCKDIKDPSKDWSQQFQPRFSNFPADGDLSSLEDGLIRTIYDQILEDVFNKAFTGW